MINHKALTSRKANLILFSIMVISILSGMSIDLIAPSLPAIANSLHIPDSIAKFLIPLYLFPYAVTSFILGILSDAHGRRKILLGGIVIFCIASILPVIFSSSSILLFARALQGAALGALPATNRPILVDIFPPEKLPRKVTLLAIMWGIGPIIGPIIGGYLQDLFNWQANFLFFFIYGACSLIILYIAIPETHYDRQAFNLTTLWNNVCSIIPNRVFIGTAILMSSSYALLIAFNAQGPFLIQTILGQSAIFYGHFAFWTGVAYLCSSMLCRKLVQHFTSEQIFFYGSIFFSAIALISMLISLVYSKNLLAGIIPALFMFSCCGILFPSGMAKMSTLFPSKIAGTGAAIASFLLFLLVSLTGFLMSLITVSSAFTLAWIYTLLTLICLLSYIILIRKK